LVIYRAVSLLFLGFCSAVSDLERLGRKFYTRILWVEQSARGADLNGPRYLYKLIICPFGAQA
jgi:hypothetical protein